VQVMLDRDLAELYTISTKALNQAYKRNKERFPESFAFTLTEFEHSVLRSQIVTLERKTIGKGTHSKYFPTVYTELGVAMLSAVIKSEKAVAVSIEIMEVFVMLRRKPHLPSPYGEQLWVRPWDLAPLDHMKFDVNIAHLNVQLISIFAQ